MLKKDQRYHNEIVDSHCHIDDEKFDYDREEVISNFENDGIDFIVDPASDIASSEKIIEIVKKYDKVLWCSWYSSTWSWRNYWWRFRKKFISCLLVIK